MKNSSRFVLQCFILCTVILIYIIVDQFWFIDTALS